MTINTAAMSPVTVAINCLAYRTRPRGYRLNQFSIRNPVTREKSLSLSVTSV